MKHEILLYINTLVLFVILITVILFYFYSSKDNYVIVDGTKKNTLELGNNDLNKIIHLNNFNGGVVTFKEGMKKGIIELISNDSGNITIKFTGTFKFIEVGNDVSTDTNYRLAPQASNPQTYLNFVDQTQVVSGNFKNFSFKFFCDEIGIFSVGTVENILSLT